jgi:GAF domain
MRSRPARLTLSALAWIALGAAAFFTFDTQQQIDSRRSALREFESTARDAADALDDAQAGQQAYVAAGQTPRDWLPKVATFLQTASSSIDSLRSSAQSPASGPALLDASTAMTVIGNVDRRVRQQLSDDDVQGAADVVFSEGADAISSAVSNLGTAIAAEQQAGDAFESWQRQVQLYALGGATGFVALVLAILGLAKPATSATTSDDEEPANLEPASGSLAALAHEAVFDKGLTAPPVTQAATPAPSAHALAAIANICTGFGRVREAAQLKDLLEQAADTMNARGLIVWLGNSSGADLRPVLAHGYSESTLARIPTVARSADNAAAAAYRSGEVQVVKSKPGASQGAIVAPLLSADGCIGALTAEIRDQGEESETTRALSLILASQLAGVLASAADNQATTSSESRTAAG